MAENKVLNSDKKRFADICRNIGVDGHMRSGIGTYREKSVHFALKVFFEENEANREVPVGRYIADIKNDSGIHEIQTSGFSHIKKKLEEYLTEYDVEIIYPVIEKKRVVVISPDTGEAIRDYNSPRHIRPAEIFKELLYLGENIRSPRLSFTLVSVSAHELRISCDESDENKIGRHAEKYNIIPTELISVSHFRSAAEMCALFPYSDGDFFTGADIRKYLRAPGRSGWAALKAMEELGIAEKCGKDGRRVIYRFHGQSSQYKP